MRCCIDAAAAVVETPTPTPTPSLPLQSPASSAPRSLNDIPSEMLGMALDYLPLADVLSCRRTQNGHLGLDAVGKVRHLNVMNAEELDARYAKIFPSVQSINVLCLSKDYFFEKLMGSASSSAFRYFVDKSAIHGGQRNMRTFLQAFAGLERVFLGGHCFGSTGASKPRSCQGPKHTLGFLFFSLCLKLEESALSEELCPEGLRPSMICSKQCRMAGEQCPLCRWVADTLPANFVCQEESVAGPWCLSMSKRLRRRIESRPNGPALARAKIRRTMERLITSENNAGDGAIRVLSVSSSHGPAAAADAAEFFIDRMALRGSGNNGQREYVMSLTKEARAVLELFLEYDSATTRLVASEEAMTESLREQMREFCMWCHGGRTGKIVIRDATLDFLVDAVGFGLDREEFIRVNVNAEPAVLNYEKWRDLP